VHHLLGPRQPAEVAVNDNAVEAVVDEGQQIAKQLGERFHGNPSRPARSRKPIRRGPGKRIVEGKSFRVADEVRYIQRRAADYDSRIVTIGQLVLFSTETGDAWLLDPGDRLGQGWLETGRTKRSTSLASRIGFPQPPQNLAAGSLRNYKLSFHDARDA
jgi:hypothetical protein